MSEPKALRIVIPWVVLGRAAFICLCTILVLAVYTILFPQWPTWGISDLGTATGFCAYWCWIIAGGRIV